MIAGRSTSASVGPSIDRQALPVWKWNREDDRLPSSSQPRFVKPRWAASSFELLVWRTSDASFEADIALALKSTLGAVGPNLTLLHISGSDALRYHRPRAPEVVLALVSSCSASWSRARGMTKSGPPQLRSQTWPWGVPGLNDQHRAQVEEGNAHLRLSLSVCEMLRNSQRPWLLSFPEQFGSTLGEPAPSIWDLREIKEWACRHKLWRFAVNQCEFGANHRRPTGILTNVPLSDRRFSRGWPVLRQREDGTSEYGGPLLKSCSCRHCHSLLPLRSRGAPWDKDPLQSFLFPVLRRSLDRGLLSGKGVQSAAAPQCTTGEVASGSAVLESDSEETVPEPSSPAEAIDFVEEASYADLPLSDVLNIARKDHSLFHAFVSDRCSFMLLFSSCRIAVVFWFLCACFRSHTSPLYCRSRSSLSSSSRQVRRPRVRPHHGIRLHVQCLICTVTFAQFCPASSV